MPDDYRYFIKSLNLYLRNRSAALLRIDTFLIAGLKLFRWMEKGKSIYVIAMAESAFQSHSLAEERATLV